MGVWVWVGVEVGVDGGVVWTVTVGSSPLSAAANHTNPTSDAANAGRAKDLTAPVCLRRRGGCYCSGKIGIYFASLPY